MLQRLPVGIQTLPEIINGNYLYVDKTQAIHRLITSGKYFFLARPRRFGKSLTLSTIKEIYQGNRALFQGLWVEQNWDWDKTNPVIHISFSSIGYKHLGLQEAIRRELLGIAEAWGIGFAHTDSIALMLAELMEKLTRQYAKVVLLIDEYDKPLIDYLDDVPQAKENQQTLKAFYSAIKDSDPYIELFLLTGISKFSKVSLFSDLNNLYDITFDRNTGDLLGYTQTELEHYFTPYMPAAEAHLKLDRVALLAQLREYYNGYTWDGVTRIYNPFSILSFFKALEFRNFWFETGTPTFLLKLLRRDHLYQLDDMEVHELVFSSYDIERLQTTPILFQTGYLTIKSKGEYGLYQLGYPNQEVRASLLMYLIADLRYDEPALTTPMVVHLHKAFQANDMERVIKLVKSIFKNIPSHIFIKEAESYYHSLIYLVFFYLGQYSESEVNTSDGRLDCVVKTPTHIYVLEFKLNQSADAAMQQIKNRGYADKYYADERPKRLLGINFSSESKTVDDWKLEEYVP